MPLQNRVTPFGSIVADPARGTLLGNRGCLHDDHKRLSKRRWTMRAWVTCWLRFKNRQRQVMSPRRYTELFFLDEATALAAGHRPCGECRRADFKRFVALWRSANKMSDAKLKAIDDRLHNQRLARFPRGQNLRVQVTYQARLEDLPDGAFIVAPWDQGVACLVWGNALLPWSAAGYGAAVKRKRGPVTVLTPRGTVAVLRAGYKPMIYESALSSRARS